MTVEGLINFLKMYDGETTISLKILTGNGANYEVVDITEFDYFLESNSLLIG